MFLLFTMDKSCAFIPHALHPFCLKFTPESTVVAVSRHIFFPLCIPMLICFLLERHLLLKVNSFGSSSH